MNTALNKPAPSRTALRLAPGEPDVQFWDRAVASAAFAELLRLKRRSVGPLLGLSFAFIIAMALLAGFAKPLMATKVAGAFNLGYLLILLSYVLCWGVSLLYVRVANRRFDAKAAEALRAVGHGFEPGNAP